MLTSSLSASHVSAAQKVLSQPRFTDKGLSFAIVVAQAVATSPIASTTRMLTTHCVLTTCGLFLCRLSGNPNLFCDGDFLAQCAAHFVSGLTVHRLFSLSALIKGPSGVVSEDTTRSLSFFVLFF